MANPISVSVRGLDLKFGSTEVLKQLNLDVHHGEFLVLLGSSGCGKSTLLNCIAGLLDINDGQIHINQKNVTWAEPSERGIGMVFQSYALYPQMTVEGNLSFGLKNARVAKNEIKSRVAQTAEILQIEALLKRKPAQLSGGQRQRVAIGRALIRDVDVFLFDEPLSNLDAKLRADLRVELKRLHQKLKNTMIYVTHDQIEAMTLADRIAIMRAGAILQLGTPEEIYQQPANRYVAEFIGSPTMNFIEGQLSNSVFEAPGIKLDLSSYNFQNESVKNNLSAARIAATLGIRPEHISFNATQQDEMQPQDVKQQQKSPSAQVHTQVVTELVETTGADTLILSRFGEQALRIRTDGLQCVESTQILDISFNAAMVSLFDTETGLRI